MIGSTDRQKSYHPFGISVCTKEEAADFEFLFNCIKKLVSSFHPSIVLGDASLAITNGFTEVFGAPSKRIICWVHMLRIIDKRLKERELRQYHAKLILS